MHIITGLDVGGAENQLILLVNERQRRGFNDIVVSLAAGGTLSNRLSKSGVVLHSLGMNQKFPSPVSFLKLASLINHYKPDIIQSWMYHANLVAALVLGLPFVGRRAKLIWGIRCSDMDLKSYSLSFRLVFNICKSLSHLPIVTLSNSQSGKVFHTNLGYKSKAWRVITNGVDIDLFRPDQTMRVRKRKELDISNNEFVIAHIGRVDPMKDHNTFLSALDLLPEVTGLVIGEGTNLLPPGKRYKRLGRRSDIAELLASVDLLVSSSAFGEGFPNVIVEGMACGLPIIATQTGDSQQILSDIGNRIVPVRDSNSIATAVKDMKNMTSAQLLSIGERNRSQVVNYHSLSHLADEYGKFYEDIC
tara:strand:- start:695 stop:1777 length:1083 start_codon:yes stop_codon:yes gene_type:complete